MNKNLSKLLPFFNPDELPEFAFIFVCSSRRSGKSVLVSDLLLNHFHSRYDFIVGLCGNHSTCRDYVQSGAIPAKYCHGAWDPDILKAWFEKSDELLKEGKKLPRTLFVCDDILVLHSQKGVNRTTSRSPWLHKLSTQGRHYNAGCILIVQDFGGSGGNAYLRNSDAVIMSPSSLYAGRDFSQLAQEYMTGDCFKLNREVLNMFSQYDFLVLRYWHASRDQKKLLSWYRVNKQSLQYSNHSNSFQRVLGRCPRGIDN